MKTNKKSAFVKAKKENRLKALTEVEIRNAYQYQKDNKDWTIYQEREFVETLFQNRFNYLLIIYSLFVNVFFMVNDYKNKLIILCIGVLITFLIFIIIYRVYVKLIIILKMLYSLNDEHIFRLIDKEIKNMKVLAIFPVNFIVGIVIPIIMVCSFLLGIIVMIFCKWNL